MRLNGWLARGVAFAMTLMTGMGLMVTARAAQAKNTPSNEIGFSVSAQLPKNQANKKNSFFDLNMAKGQQQTLKTVINNTTDRDIKVRMGINTAYTNNNGVIEYMTAAKVFDPSLKVRVGEITTIVGPKTVTVPANGSKTVSAQVKMPAKQFNGTLLGGWFFKRVSDKATGSVKGTTNLKNEYAYVIGLKYRSGQEQQPTMKLGKVEAGMINYHRGILAELRNPAAVVISNLKMNTTITSKNSGKVVKKATKQAVQMAPNTLYDYPVLTGNQKLQAGKYHLHMVVKNQAHRWVFDRDFMITQQSAQKYNKASVDDNGISIWWLVALGALGMLILILIIIGIILLIKKQRQRDEDEQ
ncbi:DUF916 and DUF3324 domain-containing protein [Lactiplantibacillus modestisalitolerans]|uniref:DUF916 and DUF3324 domain-containing protein n=1 Tax=Lactiplantibacillus modestisalitolerans TaxID=1457219 RepID=A0ABV5WRB3_9LACO|nr:DUF916 and DUF3324 domain-containing protein [Lactiplantibacillus modestisalitolerans]